MYEIMNDLQECIEELFARWKDQHKKETEKAYKETAPKDKKGKIPDYNKFKDSFCPDGLLDQLNGNVKVLFICKESNVNGITSDGTFWLREVVMAKENGDVYRKAEYSNKKEQKRDRTAQTKYFNCLNSIAQKLLNCTNEKNALKECAYMNINKRGGYSTCNLEQLKEYAKQYDGLIKKQVEILKPKKIVLLNVSLDIFADKTKSYLNNLEIYKYSRHPSRYRNLSKNEGDLE